MASLPVEEVCHMIDSGLYQAVTTMIPDHPYNVIHVIRRAHEIYVFLHNDEYKLIKIPQSSCWAFRRMMIIWRLKNVTNWQLEYLGDGAEGRSLLRAEGGRFSTYI
jgi:hypothetical protein